MNAEEQRHGKVKGSKRGSTDNKKRLDSLREKAKAHSSADWDNATPESLQGLIVAAQNIGAAITFGLSRDGGAYMVTILLDGDRETFWYNGQADLQAELYDLHQSLVVLRD